MLSAIFDYLSASSRPSGFAGPLEALILIGYFVTLTILAVYGLHRHFLVYLYFRNRNNKLVEPPPWKQLPSITVQLPIFNERYVVERLIDAVCALDYPRELLEIQVLDDSTDVTSRLAQEKTSEYARQGINIRYLPRPNRQGFKAGALQWGMERASGEFMVIFDADFLPPAACLKDMVRHFADPAIGMVQLRWEHLNRDYSLLTRVQSILLDAHFILESGTRHRSGRFFNFNGTAGMWRKAAIQESGGWQHDTLTEDLDLSYRAQMKGWKFVFLPDSTAPAEVPSEVNSFKSQQYRWAKGSIQTAKKILPSLLMSSLPLRVKTEAFFHLTANLAYPLMIVLSLLTLPAIKIRLATGGLQFLWLDLPLFWAATLSVSTFYVISQRELQSRWKSQLKYLPCVFSLGIGLSVNNTRAVLEALLSIPSSFIRTPKFSIRSSNDSWRHKTYRAEVGFVPFAELSMAAFFIYLMAFCLKAGTYTALPFLLLFFSGYFYMGSMSMLQGRNIDPASWVYRKRNTPVSSHQQ